mgnify:CR=1 FL=1
MNIIQDKLFSYYLNKDPSFNQPLDIPIDSFKLPINYLDNDKIFKINQSVSDDLELYNSSDQCIYNTIFSPKNDFAKFNVKYWNDLYTNDINFLIDTQNIIKNFDIFDDKPCVDCEIISNMWNETKNNSEFYCKYNYLDWDILKDFNTSSSLLLLLTIVQLSSPVIFFLAPLFILIVPFFILKYQGINLSFNMYYQILKEVLKQHVFGKLSQGFSKDTFNNFGILYMIFCVVFYIIQIYNNLKTCYTFYNNIKQVNDYIISLNTFINHSTQNMNKFLKISTNCNSYNLFNNDIKKHKNNIFKLKTDIDNISKFSHSPKKILEFGELLKIFYLIHSNKEYEQSIQFSIGFNGYIDNIYTLHDLYNKKHIACAKFSHKYKCKINDQVYPPLYLTDNKVKNSFDLSSNAIITGPNASGKTTALKSTIINVILTQQFGLGFYDKCYINPYTHIHSYINIPDTSNRDSLFQAESRRCKDIIDIILANSDPNKYRHFCIFDELYSGTNPIEAPKAGYSFLKYLNKFKNVNLILTTHYFFICKKFRKSKRIKNYKMNVLIDKDNNHTFTYNMVPGVSELKGAIKILKDMDYPDEIINTFESI